MPNTWFSPGVELAFAPNAFYLPTLFRKRMRTTCSVEIPRSFVGIRMSKKLPSQSHKFRSGLVGARRESFRCFGGAPTHKHLGPTSVEQPESPDEEPAPPEKLKVGVVGGSIAGLVAARALLDVGCDVEVFEMNSLENLLVGPGCFLLQRNALRVLKLLSSDPSILGECEADSPKPCPSAEPQSISKYPGMEERQDLESSVYRMGGVVTRGAFFTETGDTLWRTTPEVRPPQQPDLGVCMTRESLYSMLAGALPEGVVRWGSGVARWEDRPDGRVQGVRSDGVPFECDVLVGADGVNSRTRARLQGVDQLPPPTSTGCHCWRARFAPSAVGRGRDWFLGTMGGYDWVEFWGADARFGMFDVGGGEWSFYAVARQSPRARHAKPLTRAHNAPEDQLERLQSIPAGAQEREGGGLRGWWRRRARAAGSREPAKTREWRDLTSAEQLQELRVMFKGFSSPVPKILETLDPDTLFYSLIADRAPLPGRKWGEGAVTLVGDAAHAVLPVMGQGACMAIEDGFELSNALQGFNKRRGKKNNGSIAKEELVAALRAHERRRAARTDRVWAQSRVMYAAGISSWPPMVMARNALFRISPLELSRAAFYWVFRYYPARLATGGDCTTDGERSAVTTVNKSDESLPYSQPEPSAVGSADHTTTTSTSAHEVEVPCQRPIVSSGLTAYVGDPDLNWRPTSDGKSSGNSICYGSVQHQVAASNIATMERAKPIMSADEGDDES